MPSIPNSKATQESLAWEQQLNDDQVQPSSRSDSPEDAELQETTEVDKSDNSFDSAAVANHNGFTLHTKTLPPKTKHLHLDILPDRPASIASVRHWITSSLKENKEPYIYIDNQDDFNQFLHGVAVENGTPRATPGPLAKLFQSEGTLVINEDGFSDTELEALNEIKMDKRFNGKEVHQDFRIISIIDQDKKSIGKRSPALISRAHYCKIPASDLVDLPPLTVEPAKYHPDKAIIDCSQSDWRDIFFQKASRQLDDGKKSSKSTAQESHSPGWHMQQGLLNQAVCNHQS